MFCQNCGTNLPNESKFCSSCGSSIGTVMNTVAQKAATDTTPKRLKSQEKEALKYEKYIKRTQISLAIYGAIFLFGLIMYNTAESWWAHLGYIFLMGVAILGLLIGIAVWPINKRQYEKYKNMSDQEWLEEKGGQGQFAKDITTSIAKGAAQGFIKSLFS